MGSNLREINMEIRRQRILDSAADMIVAEGLTALNMRQLAKEVGLSVTTLYNLYGSKEAIYDALEDRTLSTIETVLYDLPDEFDPLERCRLVMGYSAEECIRHKGLMKAMWNSSWTNHGSRPRTMEFFARGAGMQETALQMALDKGILRPAFTPSVLASQLFIGWMSAGHFWANDMMSDDEFVARTIHFLIISLLPFTDGPLCDQLEQEMQSLERRLTPFRLPLDIHLKQLS